MSSLAVSPHALAPLVAPLSVDEFLTSYWNKEYLHLHGPADRFLALYPWEQLNAVLEGHRLPSPRLRLFHDGKPVPQERFQRAADKRLLKDGLISALSEGATLILDFADETSPALRSLTTALEQVFRVAINVNLYAAWCSTKGFAPHWDGQDTLILQVCGRKRWQIWQPTRQYPLKQYDNGDTPKPATEPVWDSVLEQGCVLYVPRGWWHVVHAVNEPSLHLTVTIPNATGLDLLLWAIGELRTAVSVRQDLPHFAPLDERRAYVEDLRARLAATLTPDVIDRYLGFLASHRPRPQFDLPRLKAPDAPAQIQTDASSVGTLVGG